MSHREGSELTDALRHGVTSLRLLTDATQVEINFWTDPRPMSGTPAGRLVCACAAFSSASYRAPYHTPTANPLIRGKSIVLQSVDFS